MIPADTPFWLAFLIVSGAMSLMVALRYFMASGMFAWLTQIIRPGLYAGQSRQIRMEIRYSLIAALIYGAPAGIVFWLWLSCVSRSSRSSGTATVPTFGLMVQNGKLAA